MKNILSVVIIFVLLVSSYSSETNRFDYGSSKKVDGQAGSWVYGSSAFIFFFDDGTILDINFGVTQVGYWNFMNEEKSKVTFIYNAGIDSQRYEAQIYNDVLVIDRDGNANRFRRVGNAHRMQSEQPQKTDAAHAINLLRLNINNLMSHASDEAYQSYLDEETERYIRCTKLLTKMIQEESQDLTHDSDNSSESISKELEKLQRTIDAMFEESIARERRIEIRNRIKKESQPVN